MDLDLREPRQLELAEKASAAAARAISADPTLRFQQHLLYQGRTLAPVRAPHAHPDVDSQDLADLRGGTDAVALRLRHSDRAVFLRSRPESPIAELVYEILEQFRVEALTPTELRGVRANLRHRFASWSSLFVAEGLLENEQGLLLYTTIHVCRSRILSEPIDEHVGDETESTRAGIAHLLGQHLVRLRPTIGDQAEFDVVAAAIATSIDELCESVERRDGSPRSTNALAMLTLDEPETAPELDPDNSLVATSARNRRRAELAAYSAFTTEYDLTQSVEAVVNARTRAQLRTELDVAEAAHHPVAAYLNRSMLGLFSAPVDWELVTELEQGRLDPRLLSRLIGDEPDPRVFADRLPALTPDAAVTILVDCSGSMKAVIEQVAVLVDLLVRSLDRVNVATQLLGFTTSSWNGGRARELWLGRGRPAQPGRLNELSRIVFKDSQTSWRRARGAIAGMMWTPMFREGIDGEALEWAYQRTLAQPASSHALILISDGSPMDAATSIANGESYLDRHLNLVADEIEAEGRARVFGLGIGHDMSALLRHSRVVDPEQIVTRDVATSIVAFLAGHSSF